MIHIAGPCILQQLILGKKLWYARKMVTTLGQLGIIAAALCGREIVLYIISKKRRQETLVCPIGHNCDTVVKSDFSTLLGIPLEWLGLAYYTSIALGYGVSLAAPDTAFDPLLFPLSLAAFLFSGYLTFIQAFTLKQWCTWCLGSASLSTVIFLLSSFITDFTLLQVFFQEIRPVLVIFHLFGFALGIGAATMADIFFFRFLSDLRISEQENQTLKTISQVIWVGLGVLLVSGVGIVLTDPGTYFASAKFLVKMIVVGVITVNGLFLNLYITPLLVRISFGDTHPHQPGELRHERGLAFAGGAISLTSWYTAATLGFLDKAPLPFWPLLVCYFVLLMGAIVASQLVERRIAKRGTTSPAPQADNKKPHNKAGH